ncbi:hypothetical protein [Microbacterium sp. Se5.02b]|uniref:hypothetical protein n=1 Tax=Microbacterium sp. Se5.02b TaxID=2864103 RepID=UPI00160519DA|nr:hypothetical protein [Microbacterium sp. Se5.02b]QNA92465.1 hypothetical protein G4G29_08965 [Microbacterium sp. Se63.02b]QYM65763.1 hypothetical protein K1X59_09005 [Microbacterium sp. Se5.02b]
MMFSLRHAVCSSVQSGIVHESSTWSAPLIAVAITTPLAEHPAGSPTVLPITWPSQANSGLLFSTADAVKNLSVVYDLGVGVETGVPGAVRTMVAPAVIP